MADGTTIGTYYPEMGTPSVYALQPGSAGQARMSNGTDTLQPPASMNGMFNGVNYDFTTIPTLNFGQFSDFSLNNADLYAQAINGTSDAALNNDSIPKNNSWIYPNNLGPDGKTPATFDLKSFTVYGEHMADNYYPNLPQPLTTATESHISYDSVTDQATYTFKSGDNPTIAAQKIMEAYPTDPKIPAKVLCRAVLETLDKKPGMHMKNEKDAENIPVNTQINVNQVLYEAGKLMQGYGWDPEEAAAGVPLFPDSGATVKEEESTDSKSPENPPDATTPKADRSKPSFTPKPSDSGKKDEAKPEGSTTHRKHPGHSKNHPQNIGNDPVI